jgi:hypothetical protein
MRSGTQAVRQRPANGDGSRAEVWELIQTLVSGRVPASRILELFYWSQEPGALEMLRIFLGFSAQDSAALLRFFQTVDPASVAISVNEAGELVLSPSARPARQAVGCDGMHKPRQTDKHQGIAN